MDHRIVYGQDWLPQLKLLYNYCSRKVARTASICICKRLTQVTQEMPPVSADYAAITTTKTSLIGFSVDRITTDTPEYLF